MRLDKKVSGGEIQFVLADHIGQVVWGQKVPAPLIEQALSPAAHDPQPSPRCHVSR
jgi:3-dehydroquinate synthetase